jgi:uncharacterized protein YuzE
LAKAPLELISSAQGMRIRYDEKLDALYFRLDDSKVVEFEEVKPGIVFDFNANDQVVGIEMLNLKDNLKQLEVVLPEELA